MRHPTRQIERKMKRRGGRGGGGSGLALVLLAVCVVAFGGTFGGCSSERRYKVLSFLFDGVPNPNAPVAKGAAGDDEFGATRPGVAPKMLAIVHKPYGDNQCNACHENVSGRFDDYQKLESSVCLKCHEPVRTQYPVMHGPVSVAECNLCHVPHESATPHLLRDVAPAVCTQCHQPELLSSTPREHLMRDKSCLDCHSGHGGTEHGLLKRVANSAVTQPSTAAPAGGGGNPP